MTYQRTEVARLHVGDEFVDHGDIPHVVTGFRFHLTDGTLSPGIVTVLTDQRPSGVEYPTTTLVWVAR